MKTKHSLHNVIPLRRLLLRTTLLLLCGLGMSASNLTAANWTGTNSTDWNDPGNWSGLSGLLPSSVDPLTFSDNLPSYNITYTPPPWAAFAQSLTFNNVASNLIFAAFSGSPGGLTVDASITQNGAQFVIIQPDLVCGSSFNLGGSGTGPVRINGAFLGNPALTVSGGFYGIGPGNAPSGLPLQSINLTGGTLEIGVSNNVAVSGTVVINSGGALRLCNPGVAGVTFSASSITVNGTLSGNATVSSGTIISGGGTISPGCSADTLFIVGGLTVSNTALLDYELGTPGVVGSGVNDLIDVTGNLGLGGVVNVTPLADFGQGTYRLCNYSGTLSGSGLTLGSLPSGYSYSIETSIPGEVNLIVRPPNAVLEIALNGSNVEVSWTGAGYRLQTATNLANPSASTVWTNVSGTSPVTLPTSGLHRFFRLIFPQPPGMVWIPPGAFLMGNGSSEAERGADENLHDTTLTQGIWMGRHEVTQEEYLDVIGSNPSSWRNGQSACCGGNGGVVTNELQHPVENVGWINATNYCARLTERERVAGRLPEGHQYRLPTEAEWEYACRAGTTSAFHYGTGLRSGMANFHGVFEYDSSVGTTNNPSGTYLGRTTAVGSYAPNAFGLYDMHGNVMEWCQDWYGTYPATPVTDPQGPPTGSIRVVRGGSWASFARGCRSASRRHLNYVPQFKGDFVGFRVVLAPGQP